MKDIYGYVYCVTNAITGKRYVGQTIQTIRARWRGHLKASRRAAYGSAISDAIRKYGASSFRVEQIAVAGSQDSLNALECHWIAALGTLAPDGYNLHIGGTGGPMHPACVEKLRAIHGSSEYVERAAMRAAADWADPEKRASRVEALRQSWRDPAVRAKRIASKHEQWADPEFRKRHAESAAASSTKAKIGAATKRLWDSPEYRSKVCAAQREHWSDPEVRERRTAAIRASIARARAARVAEA